MNGNEMKMNRKELVGGWIAGVDKMGTEDTSSRPNQMIEMEWNGLKPLI